MSPVDAIENQSEALQNLRAYWEKIQNKEPEIFVTGDHVRLKEERGTFDKGFVEKFSRDVYKIERVHPPESKYKSHQYTLTGIPRTFQYNDLLKTSVALTKSIIKEKQQKTTTSQKQAEKELRALDAQMIIKEKGRTRTEKKKAPIRPKGTFLYVEIPKRKKI
ncbi:hypothetical protein PhCBS80983_g06295 [Powellomyces hirtus]|uniref:Uncharacterized protein n=1 Tax=Powellomyces hirtus TaxID=109895 RepID=A0A507DNZ8_9FUNG|nr:hypothetical protein PhCBS80983_g06295 [Powellomyces hirtus]